MKAKFLLIVCAALVGITSCSKNTEPESQAVREKLYGEWEWIASARSGDENATYFDWRGAPHRFTGGQYIWKFGRTTEFKQIQQETDTSSVQELDGVYFATDDGDSLIISTTMPIGLDSTSTMRSSVHTISNDTFIMKRYYDIGTPEKYYYWIFVKLD